MTVREKMMGLIIRWRGFAGDYIDAGRADIAKTITEVISDFENLYKTTGLHRPNYSYHKGKDNSTNGNKKN